MAAASHNSRQSKSTARTTTTAAASHSSQYLESKNLSVSSKPPLSLSPTTSPPTNISGSPAVSSNSSYPSSLSGSQRNGRLFAIAAAALDKTLSGITEPRIRPRQSLTRLSISAGSAFASGRSSSKRSPQHQATLPSFSSSSSLLGEGRSLGAAPPSTPYLETDPNRPLPIHISRIDNKMHQTSSRLLRMTDDDRPFTKVCAHIQPHKRSAAPSWAAKAFLNGAKLSWRD